MVRFVIYSFGISALGATHSVSAQAETIARAICYEISSDNVRQLTTIMNDYNLRLRSLHGAIRCNGYSMLQFAITAEAHETGRMLSRALPVHTLENDHVDGVPLLQWADSSGYESSPIIQLIRQRIERTSAHPL